MDLQQRIWGFDREDIVPAAIFVVAQHTGGHAYCAFDGDRAVGFALAFSAERDGLRFWHSHMVGVLPEYQNLGVGRMLKLHQREEAIRAGVPRIEWTFDPLELRNAHFNIARLGVIIRHYVPDFYGGSTSPLHGTLPTDRFVAEWHLRSSRVEAALAGLTAPPPASKGAMEISIPCSDSRVEKLPRTSQALEIQADLRHRFTELFSRGYAASPASGAETKNVKYVLEPYED